MGRSEADAGAAGAEVTGEAGEEISEAVQVRVESAVYKSATGPGGSYGDLCARYSPCDNLWQALAGHCGKRLQPPMALRGHPVSFGEICQ